MAAQARKRHDPAEAGQRRKFDVLSRFQPSSLGGFADALVAKSGEPFLMCPPTGQIPIGIDHPFGLYFHDTRYLDGYELRLGGAEPTPLAATESAGTEIVLTLTNPRLRRREVMVAQDAIELRWRRQVDNRGPTLQDRIELRNYSASEVRLPLTMRFRARFEDVFTVRGLLEEKPGWLHEARWDDDTLEFRYGGADDVDRRLRLSFEPRPARRGRSVTFNLRIRPGETEGLTVTARIVERPGSNARRIDRRDRPRRAGPTLPATPRVPEAPESRWVGGGYWSTAVRTNSLALSSSLSRALQDLEVLSASIRRRRYYTAGVPWFATLFGRDALIAALQTLAFERDTAADTLRLLGSWQGRRVDDWREEQPGKILHELRIGELARLDEIPHSPFYGTIDATPLFLMLLGAHASWVGSLELFEELRRPVERALTWLDDYADKKGDGFLAYDSEVGEDGGLINQGWKDSGDAVVDAEGRLATPPIAVVEAQGYAYAAWTAMAELYDRAGDGERARSLRRRADALRQRFEKSFWSDSLGCYVLALAGNGEPCEVVSSNAGHPLWTGICSRERAKKVADRLMCDDMFNGWGIRTLSEEAAAYQPIGYHRGTVWPHDNSLIAAGFRRYELDDEAERIFVGIIEAAQDYYPFPLPECLAGHSRAEFGHPIRYPMACHPQAWAAGAIPYLLQVMLGLVPEAFEKRLRIVRPRMPQFVEDVEIRDLRVGDATVGLEFKRSGDRVDAEVTTVDGELEVEIE